MGLRKSYYIKLFDFIIFRDSFRINLIPPLPALRLDGHAGEPIILVWAPRRRHQHLPHASMQS